MAASCSTTMAASSARCREDSKHRRTVPDRFRGDLVLQRRQLIVGQRGERLLNDFEILVVRRRLQAHGQGEAGIVGHRRQLFGELLMQFPKAGDKRAPGSGNRLAFADRLHQAIEIGEDAIGGLVEPCCIRRSERADGLREFLTGRGQRLEGVLAFGRIGRGEQARCRGGNLINPRWASLFNSNRADMSLSCPLAVRQLSVSHSAIDSRRRLQCGCSAISRWSASKSSAPSQRP